MKHACILSLAAILGACVSAASRDEVSLFSHQGYTFVAKQDGETLFVKVTCCQTYIADTAFRLLVLDAVETRYGCPLAKPEFAPDWVGPWQLTVQLACEQGAIDAE